MASKGILLVQLKLVVALVLVSAAIAIPTTASLKGLNCTSSCGDLSIAYPFGVEKNCYLDDYFEITCNESKPLMSKIPVLNMTVEEGEVRVMKKVARNCFNESGSLVEQKSAYFRSKKFSISSPKNKFTAIGCNTIGNIQIFVGNNDSLGTGSNDSLGTGCLSQCSDISYVSSETCSGIGCCQTSIPKGVGDNRIYLQSYIKLKNVSVFNPCSYAFVVEESSFNFSTSFLGNWTVERMPMVLDWAIENITCKDAESNLTSYACGNNSYCHYRGFGYICKCKEGYKGNPYLSDGCQDIKECDDPILNKCIYQKRCVEEPGNYTCGCPKGYRGDGRLDGTRCTAERFLVIQIVVGFAVGGTAVLVCSSWLYWIFKKRKLNQLKEKFFRENGGLMLQQKLARQERSTQEVIKIFTSEELKVATKNYDESRIVGRGGNGTVYMAILSDNKTVVAVKKSNQMVDETQIEQFINEVVVLSQINHRNVVKLMGCCLETQVPLLVYEFITNGTLFQHIHSKSKESTLSWETRLRICSETAGVLSYLHSAASIPIIHRDVKTTNVLLDDNYTAKVSDFGASRLVPIDQTQLGTMVQGTLGYLDPEYLQTSQLTEKSDVYSFGVVLVELITGKKALSYDRPDEERCLANYFLSSLRNNRLYQVVDEHVVIEGNEEQLEEAANLARRCLKVKGEERPTMKEVAMELERLIMKQKEKHHPWVKSEILNFGETEYLLGETSSTDYNEVGHSSNTAGGYDSMRAHIVVPIMNGGGR